MKKLLLSTVCFIWVCLGSIQAQRTVSGTVTDESGETIIGANVIEKGTSNGTITDIDGRYTLQVAGEESILEFSFIGLETVERAVAGLSVVDLTMGENSKLLDEIVVTALGFKVNKDKQGSTYSVIDEDAVTRSGETTVINGLTGKASNVRINRSNGDPGAGSAIRIRGANTIDGSNEPLIIVDGVPLNNATTYGGGNNITGGRTGGISQQSRLNDINAADIASINVLKGASAAALWGSRAANGVVVITTKDGAAGKPKISYKFTGSVDFVSDRVEMQEVWGNGQNGVYGAGRAESWGDYIPDRAGGADEVDQSGEHFIADDGTVYYPVTTKNSRETFADKNWDDAIGMGGFMQHDFSISGGNDRSTYFFSLGRMDQEGIIKNSNYDRTNVRFNNKIFLNDWLTLSTKAAYTNSFSNRIQQSSNTAGLMLGLLRTSPDFDGNDYIGTYVDDDGSTVLKRQRSYRRPLGDRDNPTYNNANWTVNEQTSSSAVNRYLVTPQLDIKPTSWMQIILRGNADISDDKRVYFFPKGSGGDRSVGIFAEDIIGRREYNFDAIAKSNFSITNDVGLIVTAGWSLNDRRYRRNSGRITGFQANVRKETTSLNTSATNSSFENFKTLRRANRGYGVFSFDFFDQVYLNLSGAYEVSSTINDGFFYPAADLAWNFSEALGNTGPLSFGKLRLSYGVVGVQPRPHASETLAEGGFVYSTYSDPLDISLFGGGFRIDNNQGNPNLEPEIKKEFEIGTDLRFFKDKLSLGLTYYSNEINGILLDVELAPSSGYSTIYGNFGDMTNKGIEMDLNWLAYKKNDLDVSVNLNFSKNTNEVTNLAGTESIDLSGGSVSSRAIVGQPLGVLYGTGSRTNDDGSFDLDENGFPQTTLSPEILGDPNPDWRGGLGFRVGWKGFALSALLEHSQGGEFSPRTLWVLRRFGTTEETAGRVTLDRDLVNFDGDVIPAGTTVRGSITDFGAGDVLLDETWYRHGIGGGFGDNQAYNFSIKDATWTKLREITLSYTLNSQAFRDATTLGGLTLSLSGRNLIRLTRTDGIDPEVNQVGVSNGFGIEYFTNPQTASYFFSLGIEF